MFCLKQFAVMAILALTTVNVVSPAHSDESIPGTNFGYGNWSGSAFYNATTGEFSYCAVSAGYLSGDQLLFSVTRDATIGIAVANPALNFAVGDSFPATLYVDRRPPMFGRASAVSSSMAVLYLDDFEQALTALKKGYRLRIEAAGRVGEYDLAGTFRALEAVKNCAISNYNYRSAGTSAPGPSAIAGPSSPTDVSALYQLATQMITEVGASDFDYLSGPEVAELSLPEGVYWHSDELKLIGGVMLVDGEGIEDLRQSDAADASYLTGLCDGDMATKTRQISQGEFAQREISGLCLEAEGRAEYYVVKTMMGDQVLYTMLFFAPEAGTPDRESREDANDGIAVHAANYVMQSAN